MTRHVSAMWYRDSGPHILLLGIFCLSCVQDASAGALDGGASEDRADAGVDAPSDMPVVMPVDAPSDMPVVMPADAPLGLTSGPCPGNPPMASRTTVCDGAGRIDCQQWGSGGIANMSTYSVCLDVAFRCILANRCASTDPSSCHCGTGAPCRVGEVCAAPSVGQDPQCLCVTGG